MSVVHLMDRLMERQLDLPRRRDAQARAGSQGHLGPSRGRDGGDPRGASRRGGRARRSAASSPPISSWSRSASAPMSSSRTPRSSQVNRGIVVDDGLQTSIAGIHAIGECAEHRGVCYGLVEPAYEQARVLARRLAGDAAATYPGSVLATNLKVSGVNVFSAGDFLGAPGDRDDRVLRSRPRHLQEARDRGRPPRRGGALWRYRGRALVPRSHPPGASIERIRSDLVFGRALVERMAA